MLGLKREGECEVRERYLRGRLRFVGRGPSLLREGGRGGGTYKQN